MTTFKSKSESETGSAVKYGRGPQSVPARVPASESPHAARSGASAATTAARAAKPCIIPAASRRLLRAPV